MQISSNDWKRYIEKLSAINKKAGDLLREYIDKNGMTDIESVITYAHALVSKYGEASSELACQMYDSLAAALLKTQGTGNMIPAIERLVKTASSDTMLKNAKRDNAEWAWVSRGDTCAFCMYLSSLGWLPASKAILRGNHAEHIHANCDCEFAIRFDGTSTVEGYNPRMFKRIYDNAEGTTLSQKLNSIRRANYEKIKDERNAKRRELYALKNQNIVSISKQSETSIKSISGFKNIKDEFIRNALPNEGRISYDRGIVKGRFKEEISAGELYYRNFGGEIKILNKDLYTGPSPDFLINNQLWELKTPVSTKNMHKLIEKGIKQINSDVLELKAGGIILDIKKISGKVGVEEIKEIVLKRIAFKLPTDLNFIIINDNEIVDIYRFIKTKEIRQP